MADEPDVLYRYDAQRYAKCSITEWGGEEYYTTAPVLKLRTYKILKRTPKGAWIEEGIGDKRFVLLTARKRFAHLTKEEAMESYRARKRCRIEHLERQLREAKKDLALATEKEQSVSRA